MSAPARIIVFALMSCAAGAMAGDSYLSHSEWRKLTEGKTVHYEIDGAPSGREYYPEGQSFAVFVRPDGTCVEGPFAFTGQRFCFWYGPDFQCFFHLREGDALYSRPDVGGADHKVARITKGEPLFCSPG